MGYRVNAGQVAASGTNNQYTIFAEQPGPSSYPTGGFTIDLSLTFSSLNHLRLQVKTIGSLPAADAQITLNSPANGKAKVKLLALTYDKITAIGNVQNQPSGVTVQAASGATSGTEGAHTHAIDHDHGSFTSASNTNSGAGVLDQVLGSSIGTHTHTLDLPNFTGTSGAPAATHSHTDNSLYAHTHTETRATTDPAQGEIANATNLSTTIWLLVATGVKA